MITLPKSEVAGKAGLKVFPSHSRRRGWRPVQGAFVAVAAAAFVVYAGDAVASAYPVDAVASAPLVPVGEGGIALVIGNGDYDQSADPSARDDAQGVGAALGRLGFKVSILEDAGYVDMLQGLLKFSQEAQSVEAAVVFYAGRGYALGACAAEKSDTIYGMM